jgi:hypothetical protein
MESTEKTKGQDVVRIIMKLFGFSSVLSVSSVVHGF